MYTHITYRYGVLRTYFVPLQAQRSFALVRAPARSLFFARLSDAEPPADVTSPPDASDCHRRRANRVPYRLSDCVASQPELVLLVRGFQMIAYPAPPRDERARTP